MTSSESDHSASVLDSLVGLLNLLIRNPSPETIVRALVDGLLRPFDVQRASLHLRSRSGPYLHMIGDHGFPLGSTARFTAIDLAIDLPVTQALRQVAPLVIRASQLPDSYPVLRATSETSDTADLGDGDWVFLPIEHDGRPSAVLAFLGAPGATSDHQNLVIIQAISQALSLWLARAWETLPRDASGQLTDEVHPLTFSERQLVIVQLVDQGASNAEIATALCCSISTVKLELSRLMLALDATDRTQAAARARELGLLDPPRNANRDKDAHP